MSAVHREQIDNSGIKLARLLQAAYFSPEFFFAVFLRVGYLYTWQRDFLREIERQLVGGSRHIKAVATTCHGAGKDFIAAGLVQWFQYTREEARTLTLAPTWNGIKNLLWAELGRQWNRSVMSELAWGRLLDTELRLSKGSFAVGMSADRPGKLEGQHSPHAAMRLVDEAKEIEKPWFEATEGLLDAPETFDMFISTPSIEEGEHYDRDVMDKDPTIIRVNVTVDDLIADFEKNGYASLQGKARWKADRLADWGETSPAFQSRAMARYISDAQGSKLYPSAWVEAAFTRDPSEFTGQSEITNGMDVAGSEDGDENAVAALERFSDGRVVLRNLVMWSERDTTISKGRALLASREFPGSPLRVDSIGLGKGVYDMAASDGFPTEEYRASESPRDEIQFANRKAEESWALREQLRKGQVSFAGVPELLRQKVRTQFAGVKYEVKKNGKIYVIDPSDSPDAVDAIVIASAAPRLGIASVDVDWL